MIVKKSLNVKNNSIALARLAFAIFLNFSLILFKPSLINMEKYMALMNFEWVTQIYQP